MTVTTPPLASLSREKNQPFWDMLGMLLDGSATLIGVKDLDLRYAFVNQELEAVLDQPHGGMIGKSLDELLQPGQADGFRDLDRKALAEGVPVRSVEEITIGGRTGSYASSRFPIRDQTNRIIGVGVLAVEIGPRPTIGASIPDQSVSAQNTIEQLQLAVEELSQRASTDPLTGAANRRVIEDCAKQEQQRLTRYGYPVSLVFCDLDHFKRINDSFGHAFGDEVLRGFCDVVHSCIRTTDFLGRWGGEEFLIVLPSSGLDVAAMLAERIRLALMNKTFSKTRTVTASFGVAEANSADTLETWLSRADLALYKAKRGGRNRVVTVRRPETAKPEIKRFPNDLMKLVWRPIYESGHPVIDEQHRRLFDHINDLLNAIVGDRPKSKVIPLIRDFMEDVIAHFADEERILATTGYPNAQRHYDMHRTLIDHAMEMTGKYDRNALKAGELVTFLAQDVVTQHMLSEDREFFPYLSAKIERRSSEPAVL